MTVAAQVQTSELAFTEAEPHYLYSNRSYWYAQAPQNDYATATIRFTVPAAFAVVCSGEDGRRVARDAAWRGGRSPPTPVRVRRDDAVAISELRGVAFRRASTRARSTIGKTTLPLRMTSTARQRGRGREVLAKAAQMMAFYGTLVGETPYPSLSTRRPREPDPRRPRTRLRGDHQPAAADLAVRVA